jgi:hypothetical protein
MAEDRKATGGVEDGQAANRGGSVESCVGVENERGMRFVCYFSYDAGQGDMF